ncbi:MAG: type II secretion system protein [Lentisphaerae bacterium]|nr:type II secretion system protein [Lentisphaerota bacterium]
MRRRGFTLMELLTVMVIIMIMVGALIPAFHRVRKRGRRALAESEANALENAIKAYFMEYGEWPYADPSSSNLYQTADDNWDVIGPLRVDENPRGILFLQMDEYRRRGNALVDPWGNPYTIRIDLNYPGGTNVPAGVDVSYAEP